MNFRRLRALVAKDLRDTFSTAQLVMPLIIVPLVIIIGYPSAFLIAIRTTPGAVDGMKDFIANFPAWAVPVIPGLTSAGRAAYIVIVYLFAGFFLIVPVMVSTVVAANSFAGEKERRTLEGLLYTPLTDAELVVGKIAASFLPAVAFAWICFGIYTVIVTVLGAPIVGAVFFPTPNWWALMFLLVPAVSLLVISIVVLISTKARGFQEANAIGGAVVLPIIGIVAGQATGMMVLSAEVVAAASLAFAILDVGLLWLIVKAFNRTKVVSYLP
jgi:ABC-2 type transport system permease protein